MKRLLTMLLIVCVTMSAQAKVKLPQFFSDNMVLQQQKPVNVWGTADAGEKVKVVFGKQTLHTVADGNGLWRVELKPMTANNRPQVMTISGRKNKVRLDDILVGEVWLASGQSNMEYTMNNHPGGDGYNPYISDHIYSVMGNNDMPDIILGRITGRNPEEMYHIIKKDLDYERQPPTNPDF